MKRRDVLTMGVASVALTVSPLRAAPAQGLSPAFADLSAAYWRVRQRYDVADKAWHHIYAVSPERFNLPMDDEAKAVDDEATVANDAMWDARDAILAAPAQTPADLAEKARIYLDHLESKTPCQDDPMYFRFEEVTALLSEVAGVAGGGTS